jgi:hypothetical protein
MQHRLEYCIWISTRLSQSGQAAEVLVFCWNADKADFCYRGNISENLRWLGIILHIIGVCLHHRERQVRQPDFTQLNHSSPSLNTKSKYCWNFRICHTLYIVRSFFYAERLSMFTAWRMVLKNQRSWQIHMAGLRMDRNGRLHPGNKLTRKAPQIQQNLSSMASCCSMIAPCATWIGTQTEHLLAHL